MSSFFNLSIYFPYLYYFQVLWNLGTDTFELEGPLEATDNIILFPVGFRLGLQDVPIPRYLYLTSHYLLKISIE